jgi:hypothetical protein
MERPRTILVSPVTALTELNAGGNIRPCSETTAKTVPTRFQFGRASTLEQLCKAAPPQDTKLGCRSSLKKLTNLTQLFAFRAITAPTARPKVLMRRRGADCLVVY